MTTKEKIVAAVAAVNKFFGVSLSVGKTCVGGNYGDVDAELVGMASYNLACYCADEPGEVVLNLFEDEVTAVYDVTSGHLDVRYFNIENLTPHSISVYRAEDIEPAGAGSYRLREDEDALTPIPAMILQESGKVARAQVREENLGELGGIPVFRMEYGAPEDLPAPMPGKYLVVSALTAQAAARSGRDTSDLLIPAHMVRDAAGKIIGCAAFSRV